MNREEGKIEEFGTSTHHLICGWRASYLGNPGKSYREVSVWGWSSVAGKHTEAIAFLGQQLAQVGPGSEWYETIRHRCM